MGCVHFFLIVFYFFVIRVYLLVSCVYLFVNWVDFFCELHSSLVSELLWFIRKLRWSVRDFRWSVRDFHWFVRKLCLFLRSLVLLLPQNNFCLLLKCEFLSVIICKQLFASGMWYYSLIYAQKNDIMKDKLNLMLLFITNATCSDCAQNIRLFVFLSQCVACAVDAMLLMAKTNCNHKHIFIYFWLFFFLLISFSTQVDTKKLLSWEKMIASKTRNLLQHFVILTFCYHKRQKVNNNHDQQINGV